MCMNKRPRADLCLVLCALLLWFLADAQRVRTAASEALYLCAHAVIPALFPFLAVSGLLLSLGFGSWVSPRLAGLMGLYRLPGCAGSALLLGLVGGYPIGAGTAAELYRSRLLTEEEALRLLAFCNNSNPVFLISVLGDGVFGSARAGLWLWLIHVLSALLTGLCFRGPKVPRRRTAPPGLPAVPPGSFAACLVRSVRNAASGMLSVCAFVTLFYVLGKPLSSLAAPWSALSTGLLELFSLTPLLTADRTGFLLAAGLSGWGGLSVLCQTAAVLDDTGLGLKTCFLGKALQGLFSALLAAALAGYALG